MKALVTGGCSGLGLSFTKELLSRGYEVIAIYNSSEDSANKLSSEFNNLKCIKCDIRDELRLKEIVDDIDKIDLLINNASIAIDNDYKDKSYNEFMEVLSVNVGGTYNVIKYVSSKMDRGTIINISSDNTIGNNSPISMDYDASKAGINLLTLNFSEVLNSKVVAYLPGWIATDSVKEMNPDYLKEQLDKNEQKELLDPDSLVREILDDVDYQESGSLIPIKEI